MICKKCNHDMLDARLGGLCYLCESIEKTEASKKEMDRRMKPSKILDWIAYLVVGAVGLSFVGSLVCGLFSEDPVKQGDAIFISGLFAFIICLVRVITKIRL